MLFRNLIQLLLLTSFLVLSSCKTESENLGGGIFDPSAGDVIVRYSGSKTPMLSPYQKPQWIEIKNSSDNEIQRMVAMLATGAELDAERAARKYLMRKSGDRDALTILSLSLALSGQYQLAAYYGQILLKKQPSNSHAHNLRGIMLSVEARTIPDFLEAENAFKKAFDSNEKEISAGLNLGQLYLELSNPEAAFEVFKKTSIRCSRCYAAVIGYGIAAARLKRGKEAVAAFEEILQSKPSDVQAKFHLAMVYKNAFKNSSKALKTLEQILASPAQRGEADLRRRAQVQVRRLKKPADKKELFAEPGYQLDPDSESVLTGESR